MRIIFSLLFVVVSLFASDFGTLSVLVLKNGKPLAFQKLTILNVENKKMINGTTDDDGYFFTKAEKGKYRIELLIKDKQKAQAFMRKTIVVEPNKDSQVIVSLKKDDSIAFIDTEMPKTATKTVNKKIITQNGTLLLDLFSSETKKKIANATIYVKGLNTEAKSNIKGSVTLELPAGKHTLSIIHPDYSVQTLNVEVKPKEIVSKQIALSPASMELDEFVVLAPHIEGSVEASISEERNSDAVGNVLGSEEFSKSGDSSVASALKRVSGITIVGGKYVYVRGLGDRYSSVLLNGLNIPSPEPNKRVVPLDIFPTSVVQSITIQKSYTSDIPASFGGGTVLIKSKGIPEDGKGYAKLGLELLVNNSTGKKIITNSDNAKSLPAEVLNAGKNFTQLSNQTQNVLNYRTLNQQTKTLQPGKKIGLSVGKSFTVTDNVTLGASASISYKNWSDADYIVNDKYVVLNGDTTATHAANIQTQQSKINNQMSGMINLGINYFENNKIKYTYFTTSNETDRTLISTIDYSGGDDIRHKTYYEFNTKTLKMHQLSGSNDIRFSGSTDGYFDNLLINWAGESAVARRKEPGTAEYTYLSNVNTPVNWDKNNNYYYYFNLNDNVNNYRVDLTLPYKFMGNDNYTKVGLFIYDKKREYDSRTYSIFATGTLPSHPEDSMDTIYKIYGDKLDFRPSYDPRDSYSATQTLTAFYLKQLFSVTHDLDLIVSARVEDSKQQLTDASQSYDPLLTSDLFPSLGLTYRFDDDNMQLRLAYAKTISRPDFREFSSGIYLDPITENDVFGNPNLKATYIHHLDLKYEWYLSSDELFSVAVFAKQFINPIEEVMKPNNTQGGVFRVTYQNAESADSRGLEFDYRKRFGFLGKSFENLLFSTNIAYIQSNIVLNKDPYNDYTNNLTSKTRPMQGQSPYVANFILGYDNSDSGNSALFLFNQIGERIVSLGTNGNKDIYQQAFAKLDFVWKYKLAPKKKGDLFGYALRFKASNILDSEVVYTQGSNVTTKTKPGRFYSLKLNINY